MVKKRLLLSFLAVIAICYACQMQDVKTGVVILDLPSTPYKYSADTTNNHIPTLGRVLFYDPRLSLNNSVSCSSCHKQAFAFSDHVPLSFGFENKLTFRNSLPIQNLNSENGVLFNVDPIFTNGPDTMHFEFSNNHLFWDGRETLVKAMVLKPITNHIEMGITDMEQLNAKISGIPDYQTLFTNAFGSPEVTPYKIGVALAEFIVSIESRNSKFDKAINGFAPLDPIEQTGQDLFFSKYNCNSCHQLMSLNGYEMGGGFVNIGLDEEYADQGFANVSMNSADNGKFKIPSLRNIALTAPYMHDGRFSTLDEVVDHYSEGIEDHPALDVRLRDANQQPMHMNISDQEKKAIIAFLNTLTDYNMITDPRFSSPFHTN